MLKGYHGRQLRIKMELWKRDFTVRSLAKKIGVSNAMLSYVLSGKKRSKLRFLQ